MTLMASRPRVLLLTLDFPPGVGGIQEFLAQFCRHLAALQPAVIAPWHPAAVALDRTLPYPVRRIRFPWSRPASHLVPMAPAALGSVLRHRPSLIVCGHVVTAPLGLALSRVLHVPFVVFGYAMELRSPRSARLARLAVHAADAFVSISRFTAAEAQRLGVQPDRLLLIALGVAPSLLSQVAPGASPSVAPSEDLGPSACATAPSGRMLLTVARLQERYKGHDNVLRALPLIAAKVPDVRYVVVGEGSLRPYLEQLARALNVRDRVTFAGRVSDTERQRLYQQCDVFVMPSRESATGGGAEGFGIVFLEANAAGKPVVGGRSGGTSDAVLDGVTGLLVDPTDVGAIADACTRLLTDRGLAARLGAQGRRRVVDELTWPKVIARLEGALLDVIAGRPLASDLTLPASGSASEP